MLLFLQDSNIAGHLAAVRITDIWKNSTTQASEEVTPDALEEKNFEEKLKISNKRTYTHPKYCAQLLETYKI